MTVNLDIEYSKVYPDLERLCENLEEALRLLLEERSISTLTVYGRVKSLDSLREKVNRKSYTNPLDEAEDLVGLRVIVYFPNDMEAVNSAINAEFVVHEQDDKSQYLELNEVGYRSVHSVISIRDDWASTPNYRGLEGMKAEIQVRTVLMHAWAEVEHKLQYKRREQVPTPLQRRLFLLCAKFEEADSQFQSLKDEITEYQKTIAESVEGAESFDTTLELNLDTFRLFLEFVYPDYKENLGQEMISFDEVSRTDLSFLDLLELASRMKPYEGLILEEIPKPTRSNVFSYACEVFDPDNFPSAHANAGRRKVIHKLSRAADVK